MNGDTLHEPIRPLRAAARPISSSRLPPEARLARWALLLRLVGVGVGIFSSVWALAAMSRVDDWMMVPAFAAGILIGVVCGGAWFFLATLTESLGELVRLQRRALEGRPGTAR